MQEKHLVFAYLLFCYLLRPYHPEDFGIDTAYSVRIIRRSCHNLSGFACRLIVITPSRQGQGPGSGVWMTTAPNQGMSASAGGAAACQDSQSQLHRRYAATGEKISRNELTEPGAWAAWAGHHTQTPAGWISGAGHVRLLDWTLHIS